MSDNLSDVIVISVIWITTAVMVVSLSMPILVLGAVIATGLYIALTR